MRMEDIQIDVHTSHIHMVLKVRHSFATVCLKMLYGCIQAYNAEAMAFYGPQASSFEHVTIIRQVSVAD